MSTRDSDLAQALRAAAGVDDADVPRLPQAAIAELANETVETIAWTYADAHVPTAVSAPVSASANDPDALVGATEAGVPPVRGPAARVPVRLRRPLAAHGRRGYAALATALALAVAAGVTLSVSGVIRVGSNPNTSADSASGLAGWQAILRRAPDDAARKAAEECLRQLDPHGNLYPRPDSSADDRLLSEQRGQTVFTMVANDKGFGTCLTLDGHGAGGTIAFAPGYPHPAATGISVGVNHGSWTTRIADKGVETTEIVGFAGSAVTGITIRRADGVVVAASMSDGLWGAWWPGSSQAVSVTVHTRDGHSQTTPIGKVPVVPPTSGRSATTAPTTGGGSRP